MSTSVPEHTQSTFLPSHRIPFDHLLAHSHLPPPGPDYYAARRRLWLHPPSPPPPSPSKPLSPSRLKLEHVLSTPGAIYNDGAWYDGVENVWKGLASGRTLKYRLPMNIIIKILHAAWVRDDTWPTGMDAPEPDDVLPGTADPQMPEPTVSIYPSQPQSLNLRDYRNLWMPLTR
ncbi:hypothetical protein BDQ17DRAFT_1277053 [Cyathus striatus]|nr:hypothetical protein BDQ17DRAFT_1277053 [Cyathus striatus]